MTNDKEWIGISDLMSVLMLIFLFIAILFMLKIEDEQKTLAEQHQAMSAAAAAYDDTRRGLYTRLSNALTPRLKNWNALLLPDGTLRFNHPDTLFKVGSSELSDEFRRTLADFFPLYLAVLADDNRLGDIREIRIEGHTSSDWGSSDISGGEEARYIRNAALSQARAYAVLEYVYQLPAVAARRGWLRQVLRATGASYARPIVTADGKEDAQQSRRVEFHAMLKADDTLDEILTQGRGN